MNDAIKKCSDCMFSAPYEGCAVGKWDYAKCRHDASFADDSVKWHLGEENINHLYCSTMRSGDCGKAATLFVPRSAPK